MDSTTGRRFGRRMRASLDRLLSHRATYVEIAGLGSIAGGLWMVYEPASLIATGVGLVLWAQGHRTRSE